MKKQQERVEVDALGFLWINRFMEESKKQVLVETARQGDLKAAAAEIGIAYNTARATLGTVFEKLGAKNQASAVATAIHYELITAEECLAVI